MSTPKSVANHILAPNPSNVSGYTETNAANVTTISNAEFKVESLGRDMPSSIQVFYTNSGDIQRSAVIWPKDSARYEQPKLYDGVSYKIRAYCGRSAMARVTLLYDAT